MKHTNAKILMLAVALIMLAALFTACTDDNKPIDTTPAHGRTNPGNVNTDGAPRHMTLMDVRVLAEKGDGLTLDDVSGFIGTDIGSGVYIIKFIVDDEYILLAHHGGGGVYVETIMIYNTHFGRASEANEWSIWPSEDYTIDIRYYDVDKFIKDGTRELVRPFPESESMNS